MRAAFPPLYKEDQHREVVGEFVPVSWKDLDPPAHADIINALTADPAASGDRSGYAMKVAVMMLHHGYSRETAAGALLHPDNTAGAHCQDQTNPHRAARRIAEKAYAPPPVDEVFPPSAGAPGTVAAPTEMTPPAGQILFADQQAEYFKGCVYVSSANAMLLPDGRLLRQTQFEAAMGGYDFYLGDGVKKLTKTDNAWKACTQGWRFRVPKVAHTCFRPRLAPGAIISDGLLTMVNRYVPPNTRQVAGDPTPFLDHLTRLLPDERDRAILLTYMASVVQNPGSKAQWWPVIQGVEGNGKSILGSILAECVGRSYFHTVNAAKAARRGINFNGWVSGKLVVAFEEIKPGSADFLEELKPLVTNEILNVESKGVDEGIADNYANGIILTNHKDSVPITDNQRRYCPLYTAQQRKIDLARDGLTPAYWSQLYDWLRADGYAIINYYLRQLQLDPDLDPAQRAVTAPQSSSTAEAMAQSRSRETQEIIEAIEAEEPGFRGGWVSSMLATNLILRRTGHSPSPHMVLRLLTDLGYRKLGRTERVVRPDNTRTTLFAHPALPDLASPAREDAYEMQNVA